jgi:acyl carrier protein
MLDQIENTLMNYILENVLKRFQASITRDDPIISVGLIDSFHLIDLAIFIEDTFKVKIDDAELNSNTFDTIAQLSELVLSRSG